MSSQLPEDIEHLNSIPNENSLCGPIKFCNLETNFNGQEQRAVVSDPLSAYLQGPDPQEKVTNILGQLRTPLHHERLVPTIQINNYYMNQNDALA